MAATKCGEYSDFNGTVPAGLGRTGVKIVKTDTLEK